MKYIYYYVNKSIWSIMKDNSTNEETKKRDEAEMSWYKSGMKKKKN